MTMKPKQRRTTAVYFSDLKDLRRVKRAAARLGVPWTRFIREACVARANELLEAPEGSKGEAA